MLAQAVAGNILGEATTLIGNILTEAMRTRVVNIRLFSEDTRSFRPIAAGVIEIRDYALEKRDHCLHTLPGHRRPQPTTRQK